MNPMIQPNKAALISLLALACFGLSPAVRALLPPPPPDGGYPNQNTAEGNNALFHLNSGARNTAVGFKALYTNTTSSDNTAVGWQALLHNTSGTDNTSTGAKALFSNTTGLNNTANGAFALSSNNAGNGNTASGVGALFSNTTGGSNTATGDAALFDNTTGSRNTANGADALAHTISSQNTATGFEALFNNIAGDNNTADGAFALSSNFNGSHNTAFGAAVLLSNTATGNTGIGSGALRSNTTGGTLGNTQGFDVGPNVAVGWRALESNTIASANTAVGYQALRSFVEGQGGTDRGHCTAVGFQALANATGFFNSGFGYQALYNNTSGTSNVAVGARAMFRNGTGESNTAIGDFALQSNTTGDFNTAIGYGTFNFGNHTGNGDTAVGYTALIDNTTGNNNTALGFQAGGGVSTANNVICIGANVSGANVSNSCYIGNIWMQTGGSQAVYVSSAGKLGFQVSSRRFKQDIKPIEQASEAIYGLKPVSFRYKPEIEPTRRIGFGLIAEDVAEVNPELVAHGSDGKVASVRHDAVNAMLLNEFLKEHRKVQAQGDTIAQLKDLVTQQQKQLEALKTGLEEVNNQVQLTKAAPHFAVTQ